MNTKKLYRSESDRMFFGVCGGLAQYLNIDPSLVRIAFVALFFLGGHGLLIYLIMALIIPLEPTPSKDTVDVQAAPDKPENPS